MKIFLTSQLLVIGWLTYAYHASAQPVVETYDRFELNWSTMRIRFFGEAAVGLGHRSFDAAEKEAIEEGLEYALGHLKKVRESEGFEKSAPAPEGPASSRIAHELTKQAYIVNTTYFGDARVRVDLEGQLSKVFETSAMQEAFRLEEPQAKASAATAIVLLVKGPQRPGPTPVVTAPTGEILYSAESVSRSAFRKNMLGRWFFDDSIELKNFGGKAPVILEATSVEGKLVIAKDRWDEIVDQHPRLLEEAKVAFVLPSEAKARARL